MNKANRAMNEIRLKTQNDNVHVIRLDLASLKSIREFVHEFRARFTRLDILINNAGLCCAKMRTDDGFDMQFGTMHLGHFYLTRLLIDLLKQNAPTRIVNVSSLGHKSGKMNWQDLQWDTDYADFKAYTQAKLANVLFTRELAQRFGNDRVTAVSLHPGVVRTEIARDYTGKLNLYSLFYYLFVPFIYVIGKSVREGAQTTIHCAIDDSVEQFNGEYFAYRKILNNLNPTRTRPQNKMYIYI